MVKKKNVKSKIVEDSGDVTRIVLGIYCVLGSPGSVVVVTPDIAKKWVDAGYAAYFEGDVDNNNIDAVVESESDNVEVLDGAGEGISSNSGEDAS